MRKVFEIGHGKTGSTSLFHAMKRLGFTACHWPIPGSRDWLPKLLLGEDFRFDFLDGHEFSGNGLERFYRHLDRLYPDAKFILTVRDESDWLRSYQRHLQGTRNLHQPVHFYAYMLSSYGAGNFDSDLWLRAYRNHNSEVQEYFKDRPEKLLVMNVCSGDGYEKLCPFLNLPVLSEPFPRKNASENPTAARPPIAAQKPSLRSVPASASKYQGLKEWGWYLDDLQQWKSLLGRMEPTKALEIGAFDGISANLMLDELFPNPQSEIHCIDPFLPDPTTPQVDRKSTRLNSSHSDLSRMPSSA